MKPIPDLIDTNFHGVKPDEHEVIYTSGRDLKINALIDIVTEQREEIEFLKMANKKPLDIPDLIEKAEAVAPLFEPKSDSPCECAPNHGFHTTKVCRCDCHKDDKPQEFYGMPLDPKDEAENNRRNIEMNAIIEERKPESGEHAVNAQTCLLCGWGGALHDKHDCPFKKPDSGERELTFQCTAGDLDKGFCRQIWPRSYGDHCPKCGHDWRDMNVPKDKE